MLNLEFGVNSTTQNALHAMLFKVKTKSEQWEFELERAQLKPVRSKFIEGFGSPGQASLMNLKRMVGHESDAVTFWNLRKSFPFGPHRTTGNGMFSFLTCIDDIKVFC